METKFYIILNIRSGIEFEAYGKFSLGTDKKFAENLFKKLCGNEEVTEKSILSVEWMQVKNELPVNIKMLSCTLTEMAENCRIITKEIFKILNLEGV
jgi:hypothetical protein